MTGRSRRTPGLSHHILLLLLFLTILAPVARAEEIALIWKPSVSGNLTPAVGINIAQNAFVPFEEADVILQGSLLVTTGGAEIRQVDADFSSLRKVPTEGYADEVTASVIAVYVVRTAGGEYAKLCLCGMSYMDSSGGYAHIAATLQVAQSSSSAPAPAPAPTPAPAPAPAPSPAPAPAPAPTPAPATEPPANTNLAAPQSKLRTVWLQLDNQSAQVDGTTMALDVPPQLVDGRTMVPLRFTAESLGAKLGWYDPEKRITLTTADHKVILWVDKSEAVIDGQTTQLSVPPMMIDGRTMVPLRFVTENLGATLKWSDADRSIVLTATVPADAPLPAPAPGPTPAPAPQPAADYGNFVGKWQCRSFGGGSCPVKWGMEFLADGTYRFAEDGGTYTVNGNIASFTGSAAFLGDAELYDKVWMYFVYVEDGFRINVQYSKLSD